MIGLSGNGRSKANRISDENLVSSDKIDLLAGAQIADASAALNGGKGRRVATKIKKVLKKRSRPKKRRLSR